MRKYILGSLICLFGIGFASANYIEGMNGLYEFNVNSPTELGNFTYQFDYKGNLATIDASSQGNFVFNALNNNPYTLWNSYAWYNGKLYYYSKSSYNGNTRQGFIDKWCIGENLSYCYDGNYVRDTEDVIATIGTISKVVYGARINNRDGPNWGNLAGSNNPTMLCFYDGTYYCVSCSHSTSECKSGLTGTSLNLNSEDISSLNSVSWSESPFIVSAPTPPRPSQYEPCVSVGQLKARYGLTDNVCYAGFSSSDMYGDSSTYVAGSGLQITDVWGMYSGGMSFQGWYDTYYEYYKDLNNNLDKFQGNSKALLGTFFSRQTFGQNETSNHILQYCNIIYAGLDDNMSTCVMNSDIPFSGGVAPTHEEVIEFMLGFAKDNYGVNTQSGFEYTGDILDFWDDSYGFFSRFKSNGTYSGILPGYIIIGFLGIFLLYILRR